MVDKCHRESSQKVGSSACTLFSKLRLYALIHLLSDMHWLLLVVFEHQQLGSEVAIFSGRRCLLRAILITIKAYNAHLGLTSHEVFLSGNVRYCDIFTTALILVECLGAANRAMLNGLFRRYCFRGHFPNIDRVEE